MHARDLRTPRERTLFGIAVAVSALAWLILVVTIVGLIYGVVIGLFVLAAHALFLAHVAMNGVRIGPDQLPDLHAKVLRASSALGLERPPEAYVLQGDGMLNAFATKLLSRHFVIILADLVQASEAATAPDQPRDTPDVLDFVIAHEMGHLAAGHLAWNTFLLPARVTPWLGPAYSRACEYTSDLCGYEVVTDLDVSSRALAVLAAGGSAGRRVNVARFADQRRNAGGFWASVLELNSTHPFLPKRIAALEERVAPGTHRPVPRNVFAYPLAPVFGLATGGSAASGLMMVAIVGIIAAIAIPNLLNAIQGGKAKRTMADLRSISAAVEGYGADVGAYPEVAGIDELAALLEPTYARVLPRQDAWGTPFKYWAWTASESGEEAEPGARLDAHAVGSAGKDGIWEHEDLEEYPGGETTDFDADILFVNGEPARHPSVVSGAETAE